MAWVGEIKSRTADRIARIEGGEASRGNGELGGSGTDGIFELSARFQPNFEPRNIYRAWVKIRAC